MEQALSAIYGLVVGQVLPFILLIGVLIFVHELGHFTLAKLFKIEVERFSIGFGPRIFGWKWGPTEYRVAWIPLGGYVKMKGDDPSAEIDPREIPGSFLGAAVWKRVMVVLAGPGVNLILPIFVLATAASIGHSVNTSYVGWVRAGSPAEHAGIEPGDRIVNVNGQEVQKWDDMTAEIGKVQTGDSVEVIVDRNGTCLPLTMGTTELDSTDEFGSPIKRPIIGISHYGIAPVAYVDPASAAANAGLKSGDEIVGVGEQRILVWQELERAVASAEGPLTITIRRAKKQQWYQLDPPPGDESEVTLPLAQTPPAEGEDASEEAIDEPAQSEPTGAAILASLGIQRADTRVGTVALNGPARDKIQPGDVITSVGGEPIDSGIAFSRALSEMAIPNLEEKKAGDSIDPIEVEVLRDGATMTVSVAPMLREPKGFFNVSDRLRPWVGFGFVGGSEVFGHFPYRPSDPDLVHERVPGFAPALLAGLRGTGEGIGNFLELGKRVLTGRASVRKNIGGPLAIGYVAGLAARGGIVAFLMTIASLSIVLGIMNLLPIPVLDGGHLFFFSMEAIMGRPPSLRFREIAQQVGVVLLLALMVFVMFNDVTRFF